MRDVERALSEMSVEEKARLVVGKSFWRTCAVNELGIPSMLLTDGPHGIRKQVQGADNLGLNQSVPATCFPTASLVACSFDPSLVRLMGQALGEEARKEHVAVLLGPGANIKRHPLCGRNFEYFSEDPLLAGELAAAWIDGVQSRGVGASLKHFACNSQETGRMVSDSVVDERALNEVYLRPFELAVRKARPWTVMASYNRVNGVHATESPLLLTQKLRREWGFAGLVVTDWGAICDARASIAAGLDLAMPGPNRGIADEIARGVESGALAASGLDRAAGEVVRLSGRHRAGQEVPFSCHMDEHLELAQRIAEESAVLLENDGTLPLSREARIAVIGAFAKEPRYQGSGSSRINPVALDSAWDAFWEADCDVEYAMGFDRETGEADEELLAEAEKLAARRDVAVVFAGLPDSCESEGRDRTTMALPAGEVALIDRVCAANPRTVVVLQAGSALEAPWRHEPAALLYLGLSGCRGGNAAVELLLGTVTPCGKLAETWPERLADTALGDSFPETRREVLYRESIYVGYRYYDTAGLEVAYPFGHGLSYVEFEYSDLRVEPSGDGFDASVQVRNAGERYGTEVVQFYLHAESATAFMPAQWLVGFDKVVLAPGKRARARAHLDARAFSYWDAEAQGWRADEGAYELRAASSSRDVRLAARVGLSAKDPGAPFAVSPRAYVDEIELQQLESYYEVVAHGFSDEEFAMLYGDELPSAAPLRPFTFDSPFSDLKRSFRGRAALKLMLREAGKRVNMADPGVKETVLQMMDEMPLRALEMAGVAKGTIEGLLKFLNTGKGGPRTGRGAREEDRR